MRDTYQVRTTLAVAFNHRSQRLYINHGLQLSNWGVKESSQLENGLYSR